MNTKRLPQLFELVVCKVSIPGAGTAYYLEDVPDEELSKYQLFYVLASLGVDQREINKMHAEFTKNPKHDIARFGIGKSLLYTGEGSSERD